MVFSIVALLLFGWLIALCFLIASLETKSNGFFKQLRVGQNGRLFTIYKLKTIDPKTVKVTFFGNYFRKYKLDELPQLFDVMAGHMSLIGPRPPLATEVAKYGPEVRRRLRVKPGLTGLWQVSGRSDLSWEESVRLDLHYVENWSLGLDLSILVRTARAVLARSGAY